MHQVLVASTGLRVLSQCCACIRFFDANIVRQQCTGSYWCLPTWVSPCCTALNDSKCIAADVYTWLKHTPGFGGVHRLEDVVAVQAGDGDVGDVLLGVVAASLQELSQLVLQRACVKIKFRAKGSQPRGFRSM